MSIQEFFTAYAGKSWDFDGYYGPQCVDLVQFYNRDVVGAPRLTGNAADVWDSYPTANYDRIPNTPQGVPQRGDVMVWNRQVGAGNGHIAIVSTADVDKFQSLDQNWSGPTASFVTHDYGSVLGWLHPKTAVSSIDTVPVKKSDFEQLVTKSTAYDALDKAGIATPADVAKLQTQLKQSQDKAGKYDELVKGLKDLSARFS